MKNDLMECRQALQFVQLFSDWSHAIHMSDSADGPMYPDVEVENASSQSVNLTFRQVFLRSRALQRALIHLSSLAEVRVSFCPPSTENPTGGKAWPALLELFTRTLVKPAFQGDLVTDLCTVLFHTPIHHEGCIKWLSALLVTMMQDWQDDALKVERARLQYQSEEFKTQATKLDGHDDENQRVLSRSLVLVYAKLDANLKKTKKRKEEIEEQTEAKFQQVRNALNKHLQTLGAKKVDCDKAIVVLHERRETAAIDANNKLEGLVLDTKSMESDLISAEKEVERLRKELAQAESNAKRLREALDNHETKIAGIRMEMETSQRSLQVKIDTASIEGEAADEEQKRMTGFDEKLDEVQKLIRPALKASTDDLLEKVQKWNVFLENVTKNHLERERKALLRQRAETETALKSLTELTEEEKKLGEIVKLTPDTLDALPTESPQDVQRRIRTWQRYHDTLKMLRESKSLFSRCVESETEIWSSIDSFLRAHSAHLSGNEELMESEKSLRQMHADYILQFGPYLNSASPMPTAFLTPKADKDTATTTATTGSPSNRAPVAQKLIANTTSPQRVHTDAGNVSSTPLVAPSPLRMESEEFPTAAATKADKNNTLAFPAVSSDSLLEAEVKTKAPATVPATFALNSEDSDDTEDEVVMATEKISAELPKDEKESKQRLATEIQNSSAVFEENKGVSVDEVKATVTAGAQKTQKTIELNTSSSSELLNKKEENLQDDDDLFGAIDTFTKSKASEPVKASHEDFLSGVSNSSNQNKPISNTIADLDFDDFLGANPSATVNKQSSSTTSTGVQPKDSSKKSTDFDELFD
eukprot:GDKJ01016494.1.p1 GENE.GDKJ01016494.1~~GDKJ01016494.1.p1  ORF type:complete len:872 (-),score=239.54 GDKJ01016494.1:100-2553(-)